MKNPFKKASKKKKIIFAIIFIVVICIGGSMVKSKLGGGGADMGVPVSAGSVERGNVSETISVKSTVEGSDSANVYSAVDFRITNVTVKEGDMVTVDQVLATLDADDRSDEYNKARIAYDEAKHAYENAAALYAEGAIAETEYRDAKATYETSALTLNSIDLSENTSIKSPIAGTVTRVNATVGKLANSGSTNNEPLFVIENLDNLQMKVKISEYDISKIRVGQTAEITAEVLGKETVSGVVSNIAPTGEARGGDSSEMVIPVVIDIDKGDTNLIAGVTAKATILIDEASDVLTVPIDAVWVDPATEEVSVFLIREDSTLAQVMVNVGLEGDFYTEISPADGTANAELLTEGAQVALAPTYDFVDGMTVTVQQ